MLKNFSKLFGLIVTIIWICSGLYDSTLCQQFFKVKPINPNTTAPYFPEDINEAGHVVGTILIGETPKAFLWKDNLIIILDTGSASGINDSDQVVGNTEGVAWLWENGVMIPIVGQDAAAHAINNIGQVVGEFDTGDEIHAFLWQDGGGVSDLGTLPDHNFSSASAINYFGEIVGRSLDLGQKGTSSAVRWQNNIIDLGICEEPEFYFSEAYDINKLGQVVGNGGCMGFLWDSGSVTDLGFVPFGINDSTQVVGYLYTQGEPNSAVIWDNGFMTKLEDLVADTSLILNEAWDINNKGMIICSGGPVGDVAYVLYKPYIEIKRPTASLDTLWIAGEKDTIRWETGIPGALLMLEYSTNSGQTFHMIEDSVDGDSLYYVWDKPDTILSTKCIIKVTDMEDSLITDESDILKIKGYIITRLDANGDYIAYDINIDRWGFRNWRPDIWYYDWYKQFNYRGIDPFTNLPYPEYKKFKKARRTSFPDWVSWVNTFGVSACYTVLGKYNLTAVVKWQYEKDWEGSCFGIAVANGLAFCRRSEFQARYPNFPAFSNPISVVSDTNVIRVVNELQTHQYGDPHNSTYMFLSNISSIGGIIRYTKEMLKPDNVQIRTLIIKKNNGTPGAHALLPYKYEKVTPDIHKIYVYDDSWPEILDAFVEVTFQPGTSDASWQTYYAWTNWGGNSHLFLMDPVEDYLTNPSFSRFTNNNQSPFILEDTELQIFIEEIGSILITNQAGESIGYYNDSLIAELPDATPIILINGSTGPPIGYNLQSDEYSIVLKDFLIDTISVGLFNSNKSFVYDRVGAQATETDRIFFDGGVSAINPDQVTKNINLLNIVNETVQEKSYYLSEIELSQNDSVKIENVNDEELKFTSFGSAKDYDIELHFLSDTQEGIFEASDIPLSANTSHTLVPDWTNVANTLLVILIDEGNNGTIDDTLEVANQSGNPTTFQLAVIVNDGWNMVSVPGLHPDNQDVTTWWPDKDPSAGVFSYNGGYNQVTTVTTGSGYWMKNLVDDTLNTGDEWPSDGIQTVIHNPINGLAGWNLIGGYEQIVPVSNITTNPPGLQDGNIYGYSEGYTTASELNPGYAYWIKLTSPGEIILSGTAAKNTKSKSININSDWGKIILTDASGKNYTLYSVNTDLNLSSYDMPPLPPDGIFDIRFGSGRFAENLNGVTNTIELRGVVYPVQVRVEDVTLLIQDETGKRVKAVLQPGEQISIDDLDKLFVTADMLPVKYSLEQNYPNPFNPVTKIKYSIAQNNFVTITVYDVLGREVKKLVNEDKPTGSYEVEFDASTIASGVYIYKIKAGNFVNSKKMILMK